MATFKKLLLIINGILQYHYISFTASPLEFSEIGYLLLPSRDMVEISLKATFPNPQYNQPTYLLNIQHIIHYTKPICNKNTYFCLSVDVIFDCPGLLFHPNQFPFSLYQTLTPWSYMKKMEQTIGLENRIEHITTSIRFLYHRIKWSEHIVFVVSVRLTVCLSGVNFNACLPLTNVK